MNQIELTGTMVPAAVCVAEPMPIQKSEDLDAVGQRIMGGQAYLKVVEYPWGLEFDICKAEGTQ